MEGEKAKQFHGFKKDIESVGDFIRLYTTRYRRWLSPKFLIGESYGTTRAAGLAGYLQERHGLYLNGIMLVSAVLNFSTLEFDHGNDLPYVLFLPTYAATAWYHKRLAPDLQARSARRRCGEVEAVRRWANTRGRCCKDAALTRRANAMAIAEQLARYTGLSRRLCRAEQPADRAISRFFKELLRDQRRTVGRLDSRFTGIDRDAAGERIEYDPSYANDPWGRTRPPLRLCARRAGLRERPALRDPDRARSGRGATPSTKTSTSTWPSRCARR